MLSLTLAAARATRRPAAGTRSTPTSSPTSRRSSSSSSPSASSPRWCGRRSRRRSSERQKKILGEIDAAERARGDAESAKARFEKDLAAAREESSRMIVQAKADARRSRRRPAGPRRARTCRSGSSAPTPRSKAPARRGERDPRPGRGTRHGDRREDPPAEHLRLRPASPRRRIPRRTRRAAELTLGHRLGGLGRRKRPLSSPPLRPLRLCGDLPL